MNDTAWWYLARAAGLMAWILLTLTLLWGTLVSGRLVANPRLKRWLHDVHPFLAGLGLGALALHIVAAIADTQSKLSLTDVALPFQAGWNPSAIAYGALGLWLLVMVEVTALLRDRLPRGLWRKIYLLSYGACWATALHAAFAGTDLAQPWIAWTGLGLVAAATGVSVSRALSGDPALNGRAAATNPRIPTGVGS